MEPRSRLLIVQSRGSHGVCSESQLARTNQNQTDQTTTTSGHQARTWVRVGSCAKQNKKDKTGEREYIRRRIGSLVLDFLSFL